jgi:excisionase family DNA binding protein
MKQAAISSCLVCFASEGFVNSSEAAALLQVNASSIRRWLNQGKAHGFKTPGGRYRICRRSLFQSSCH